MVSLVQRGAVNIAIWNGIKQATTEDVVANSTALRARSFVMSTSFIIGGGDLSPDRMWR